MELISLVVFVAKTRNDSDGHDECENVLSQCSPEEKRSESSRGI